MVRLLEKRKRTVNLLTTFAIATFSLHLIVLLFLIIQGVKIRQLSLRKPPHFMELIDGKPVAVTNDLERDPEVIRQFVSKTMISMFNWSGTLPAQNIEEATKPKPDGGILIQASQGGSRKVSTSSWIASFALSEDFRKGFLREIAGMTPPEVFGGDANKISAQLTVKRVYPPQQVAPGKWRVGMVADLIQKRGDDNQKIITPFNKDLLVRAVDFFPYPLNDNSTNLQKAIYSIRNEKLEIYEIRELCLLDEYDNQNPDKLQQCGTPINSGSFTR